MTVQAVRAESVRVVGNAAGVTRDVLRRVLRAALSRWRRRRSRHDHRGLRERSGGRSGLCGERGETGRLRSREGRGRSADEGNEGAGDQKHPEADDVHLAGRSCSRFLPKKRVPRGKKGESKSGVARQLRRKLAAAPPDLADLAPPSHQRTQSPFLSRVGKQSLHP